jgi:hypothetical protein
MLRTVQYCAALQSTSTVLACLTSDEEVTVSCQLLAKSRVRLDWFKDWILRVFARFLQGLKVEGKESC